MSPLLTPMGEALDPAEALVRFNDLGYARLGPVLDPGFAQRLAERADALMQDDSLCPGLFYQHESPTGRYEDLVFNAGWVGPSSRYRKLERLELDPLFRAWIDNPLFARLATAALAPPIRLYRSVLWNKAANGGMAVPWHQDDGRFWGLSQPPALQVWTALDDAPEEAGCLEVVPRSHLGGLASPEGGTIPESCLEQAQAETRRVALRASRGDCILVHNHTWHRTGRNHTARPRRALSISLLGGQVRCTRRRRQPRAFVELFGASGSGLDLCTIHESAKIKS